MQDIYYVLQWAAEARAAGNVKKGEDGECFLSSQELRGSDGQLKGHTRSVGAKPWEGHLKNCRAVHGPRSPLHRRGVP